MRRVWRPAIGLRRYTKSHASAHAEATLHEPTTHTYLCFSHSRTQALVHINLQIQSVKILSTPSTSHACQPKLTPHNILPCSYMVLEAARGLGAVPAQGHRKAQSGHHQRLLSGLCSKSSLQETWRKRGKLCGQRQRSPTPKSSPLSIGSIQVALTPMARQSSLRVSKRAIEISNVNTDNINKACHHCGILRVKQRSLNKTPADTSATRMLPGTRSTPSSQQ